MSSSSSSSPLFPRRSLLLVVVVVVVVVASLTSVSASASDAETLDNLKGATIEKITKYLHHTSLGYPLPEGPLWHGDYEEAVGAAFADKKPMMVVITEIPAKCYICKLFRDAWVRDQAMYPEFLLDHFHKVFINTEKFDELPLKLRNMLSTDGAYFPRIYFLTWDEGDIVVGESEDLPHKIDGTHNIIDAMQKAKKESDEYEVERRAYAEEKRRKRAARENL
eukprot:TRINITY_DN562_c1_g1_i1.p1 TRINITY_DN562_c1_g1~~TRINITY_DN562_c1_g1_i1.p1  ORF type:complete len:229 (-),score=62.53 TRINITY_DN562_c1_g1_i1:106-771(-)